jgi:hypothetical protein
MHGLPGTVVTAAKPVFAGVIARREREVRGLSAKDLGPWRQKRSAYRHLGAVQEIASRYSCFHCSPGEKVSGLFSSKSGRSANLIVLSEKGVRFIFLQWRP